MRISDWSSDVCSSDRRQRVAADAIEVRRLTHVGRIVVPLERVTLRHVQTTPVVVAGKHVGITLGDQVGLYAGVDDILNLAGRWPDDAQVHQLAVSALAERVLPQVSIGHAAYRERVGSLG